MTLQEFVDGLYVEGSTPPAETVIRAYEENQELINKQNSAPGTGDYDRMLRLISDYAFALAGKKDFEKAGIFLNKAIMLWENYGYSENELSHLDYYLKLRTWKGITHMNAKQYRKALKEFRWVATMAPLDKTNKMWSYYAMNKILNKLGISLVVIEVILIIIAYQVPYASQGRSNLHVAKLVCSSLILATLFLTMLNRWHLRKFPHLHK